MKKGRNLLDELARLGCLFLVTAVESLSNEVLKQLDKGHRREDVSVPLAEAVKQNAQITKSS